MFPAVIFLPLCFLAYEVNGMVGPTQKSHAVVTDSLNTDLPNPADTTVLDKYDALKDMRGADGYTAMQGLDGERSDGYDNLDDIYSEREKNHIDSLNAIKKQEQEDIEELRRSIYENSKHYNKFADGDRSPRGGKFRSRNDEELDQYAKDVEYIRKRANLASKLINGESSSDDSPSSTRGRSSSLTFPAQRKGKDKQEPKVETVRKVPDKNAAFFHTVGGASQADTELIKAMIDQTIKVQDGTRLRLKLLDDVVISNVKLKKGAYLYAIISGFSAQRVMAKVTNILAGNKFLKVSLSIYDNDGMEGFYVPMSAFRDLMKEAGAQAMNQGININSTSSSDMNAESFALQTLQSLYQSTSQSVAKNMRKNKAKIKYNTIVYLIND